jgi:outer membrane protein W
MKKLLFSIALAGGLTTLAQPIEFGLNFTTGLPMGASFSEGAGIGLGGNLEMNYYINSQLSVGIEGGYNSFLPKTIDLSVPGFLEVKSENQYSIIPILIKADYYFLTGSARPYAGIAAGYYLVTNNQTSTTTILGVPTEVSAKGVADGMGIRPEAGLLYVIGPKLGLNLSVGYNLLFNGETVTSIDPNSGQQISETFDPTNFLAINLGLRIKLDTYEAGGFLREYF